MKIGTLVLASCLSVSAASATSFAAGKKSSGVVSWCKKNQGLCAGAVVGASAVTIISGVAIYNYVTAPTATEMANTVGADLKSLVADSGLKAGKQDGEFKYENGAGKFTSRKDGKVTTYFEDGVVCAGMKAEDITKGHEDSEVVNKQAERLSTVLKGLSEAAKAKDIKLKGGLPKHLGDRDAQRLANRDARIQADLKAQMESKLLTKAQSVFRSDKAHQPFWFNAPTSYSDIQPYVKNGKLDYTGNGGKVHTVSFPKSVVKKTM